MKDPTLHKLQERVKELTALHRTARILQDETRPSHEIVSEIVHLLPAAWQYPDVTQARIRFRDICEATAEFRETPWMQTVRFITRSGDQGTVEVAYVEERPSEAEGPFLAEERDVIDSLAEMLRSYFQRKLADEDIQAAHAHLEQLVLQRTEELRQTNTELQQEIVEHQTARQQVEQYQNRLRELAAELSLADARERHEIAIHLHDHIIQEFAFIKLRIAQFRGDAVFCGFEQNLKEIISLLEGAIQQARKLTFDISTPILYELGLSAALEWLAEYYMSRHNLNIHVKLPKTVASIPEAIRVTLYKCVQELLTNVAKYAHATTAEITLDVQNHQLTVEVSDNGVGFDTNRLDNVGDAQHGFGLFSIRERLRYLGGHMELQSTIGQGTTVRLSVTLEPK